VNDRVYIHELITITKQNRARYMHHMTANWSPLAQEQRHQLCYGVWGVVGSTGHWPQVVNLWEEDGFPGLASSFSQELGHPALQDPALEKWWRAAAGLRSGGFDRILVPHQDTATIEELCGTDTGSEAYAHEVVKVSPGQAWPFLDSVLREAGPAAERTGWLLLGAWCTAMRDLDECVLLWGIPAWKMWAAAEADLSRGRETLLPDSAVFVRGRERMLLVDSPLSPLRTGRQPSRADRDCWTD
jgi:hypothetical protein